MDILYKLCLTGSR